MTCRVIRVTRPNTLLIRAMIPALQSECSLYMVLAGILAKRLAARDIVDWLELHENQRFRLVIYDWWRDSFGRLLGDLADIRTGETLTSFLVQRGVAKERPDHLNDVLIDLINGLEADEP